MAGAGTWEALAGPSVTLMVHVAGGRSPPPAVTGPAGRPAAPASTVVLVHDFPLETASAERTGRSLPPLADRLAAESGWRVVAGCLRGVGGSSGEFSPCGWTEDLGLLVEHAATLAAGGGIWLVGFGLGGTLALCLAPGERRVRGVACFGAPATLAGWAEDPAATLAVARQVGAVRSSSFPPDLTDWARGFTELRPVEAAAAIGARSALVVHGAEDDEVPVSDARLLADAVGPRAELHVLAGAGHALRADPRAVALLVGWLERQSS